MGQYMADRGPWNLHPYAPMVVSHRQDASRMQWECEQLVVLLSRCPVYLQHDEA